MKSEDNEEDNVNDIPEVIIADNYDYVSTSKVIANIVIKRHQGEETRRPLVRTKKGGYMML